MRDRDLQKGNIQDECLVYYPFFIKRYLLREIFLFDAFHRHFLPGPQFKGGRSLVEQHIKAVEERAAGFFGHLEELCLPRVVDDVGDDEIRAQEGAVRNRAGVGAGSHSQAGAVGQDVAFGDG